MRTTPLTPMLLANLDCFTLEQLEKITDTEPEHNIGWRQKCRFGVLAEQTDFRDNGGELFVTRNKPRPSN